MNYSEHNNRKRQRRHRAHGKKIKNKIGFLVWRGLVAAVLIGTFALASLGLGAYFGVIDAAPELPPMYRFLFETQDTVFFDAYGNEFDRLDAGENQEFVALADMPDHVWQAFVAIEDERFFEHNGVDTRGIVRAVYQTLVHENTQGGSTITQQLIKNMRGLMRNTIESKLQEIILAVEFEARLTNELGCRYLAKDYILESYLNMIALGHGQLGVQAAARFYFNKDISELTISEAAVIAAIPPNPTWFSPVRFPLNNRARAEAVLDKMLELGFITETQHRIAWDDPVYDRIQSVDAMLQAQGRVRCYFSDALVEQLQTDLMARFDMDIHSANRMIFGGGLQVHSTKVPWIQDILDDTFTSEEHELFPSHPLCFFYTVTYHIGIRNSLTGLTRWPRFFSRNTWEAQGRFIRTHEEIPEFLDWVLDMALGPDDYLVYERVLYSPQPQASMIIIDHNNGHVVGMAGGRGEKQTDRAFNRATQSMRQPGSVFKMFAYAPAIDMGLITAATTFDDTPHIIFDYTRGYISWPNNWWGDNFRGFSSVRRAVEMSYNVVAAKAGEMVGLDAIMNYLYRFGFTTLTDRDRVPAIVLGGIDGITNIDITSAFGAMANGGMLHAPILYTRVLDRNGNVLLENVYEPTMVINRNTAYLLTDVMRGVMTGRGTAGQSRLRNVPMDQAGKTGTTNDAHDVYFVGYTPWFTAGVWVGYDFPRHMTRRITDQRPDTRIWRHVMEQVHENLEYRRFERPAGFTTVEVCAVSGLLPRIGVCCYDPRGRLTRTEIFAPGTAPTEFCDIHMVYNFNFMTGRPASPFCPPAHVVRTAGIRRDRSFMEITGNVGISDSIYEVPLTVLMGMTCDCHLGGHTFLDEEEDEGNWWDHLFSGEDEDEDPFYVPYIPETPAFTTPFPLNPPFMPPPTTPPQFPWTIPTAAPTASPFMPTPTPNIDPDRPPIVLPNQP